MSQYLWLIPLGFLVGTYGTLIGAGGGFVLVPILLLLYPNENPEIITSISLAVVFFNALSGSGAYARMRRIDYKSGLLFALAATPGAILGALSTAYIPRRSFDAVFGILLIVVSIFLFFHSSKENDKQKHNPDHPVKRSIIDQDGIVYNYSYNPVTGVLFSIIIGYVSSVLGIGGGIIHVPVLSQLLNFPIHIATATSHFVLVIMSLTGTIVHVVTGSYSHGIRRTTTLAIGVLLGAQLGATLSRRVRGRWIIRFLAIALGFIGLRILLMALYPG